MQRNDMSSGTLSGGSIGLAGKPDLWSKRMSLGRVMCYLIVLSIVLSLVLGGSVLAREGMAPALVDQEKTTVPVKKEKSLAKSEKVSKRKKIIQETVKSGPASLEEKPVSLANSLKPQTPIVMGRSVSDHRKTKLHHVKIQPPEAAETREPSGGT
ncbi:MAG: hypothetical protein FWC84_06435 [Alphaproteobacteria bacterium]|nr:hypothetical protein [Alphaproteobacteria bacterium]